MKTSQFSLGAVEILASPRMSHSFTSQQRNSVSLHKIQRSPHSRRNPIHISAAASGTVQNASTSPLDNLLAASTVPTRRLSTQEAMDGLYSSQHATQRAKFAAFYSSELGGIVTDPALMVVQLDDHLVHRGVAGADVRTGRARDGGAGEPAAGLHVVAVAGVGGGIPEIRQDQQVVLERRQRREAGGELEVPAGALGRPLRHVRAVGHVERGEAHGRLRGGRALVVVPRALHDGRVARRPGAGADARRRRRQHARRLLARRGAVDRPQRADLGLQRRAGRGARRHARRGERADHALRSCVQRRRRRRGRARDAALQHDGA